MLCITETPEANEYYQEYIRDTLGTIDRNSCQLHLIDQIGVNNRYPCWTFLSSLSAWCD